jgi:GMP synthase (glutamine-hydrolysing)
MDREKILLVVHQATSDPGRIGRMVDVFGYQPVICRHACGDPLPESLDDYAGAVIFGGPMSANDDHLDFVRDEQNWIGLALKEDKPFLGVCLGAQMLARHLGANVTSNPEGYHEIGYYPVRATAAGRGLFADEQMFYQWHGEGFELPSSCELLATGERFPNQAFRYGKAIGIQFHPEVTRQMMERWTLFAAHRMVLAGAQPRESHLRGHDNHDAKVESWTQSFFGHWLSQAGLNASIPVSTAAE